MSRYSFVGFRGGETLTTPAGQFQLHATDGAIELTATQHKQLGESGYVLRKAAETPPKEVALPPGPEHAEIQDALKRGEEQVAAMSAASAARAAAAATKLAATASK